MRHKNDWKIILYLVFQSERKNNLKATRQDNFIDGNLIHMDQLFKFIYFNVRIYLLMEFYFLQATILWASRFNQDAIWLVWHTQSTLVSELAFHLLQISSKQGCGCSTTVEHVPAEQKLLSSWVRFPPGARLFSSISIPQ